MADDGYCVVVCVVCGWVYLGKTKPSKKRDNEVKKKEANENCPSPFSVVIGVLILHAGIGLSCCCAIGLSGIPCIPGSGGVNT